MGLILYFLFTFFLTCFNSRTEGIMKKNSPLNNKEVTHTDGTEHLKNVDVEKSNGTSKLLNDSNVLYFKLAPNKLYNNNSHINNTAKLLNITLPANLNNENENKGFSLASQENFRIREDRLIETIKNNLEQLLISQIQRQKTPISSNIVEPMDDDEKLLTESQSKSLHKDDIQSDQINNKITPTTPTYDDLIHKLKNILKKGSKYINFKQSDNVKSSDVKLLLNVGLEAYAKDANQKPKHLIPSRRRFTSNRAQLARTQESDSAIRTPSILRRQKTYTLPKTVYNNNIYPLHFCDGCKGLPVFQTVPLNTIIRDNVSLRPLKHSHEQGNIVRKIIPSLYLRPFLNGVYI